MTVKISMATIDELAKKPDLVYDELIKHFKDSAEAVFKNTGSRPTVLYVSEEVAAKLVAAVDFSVNPASSPFDKHIDAIVIGAPRTGKSTVWANAQLEFYSSLEPEVAEAVRATIQLGQALLPFARQNTIGRDGRPVRKHPICRR